MNSTLHQQITQIIQQQIATKKHCLLSTVKHRLHDNIQDNQIVKSALLFKSQHKQLEILCFLSYVENNQFHTYYEIGYQVEKFLERRKNGTVITELFIQFMCLYVKSLYQLDEIIEVVLDDTRELYRKGLDHQVERNLTMIPPNAIMRDGRMYCQVQPEKFQGIDMDENLMAKVRQALKQKKKLTGSVKEESKQQGNKKNTKEPLKPTKSQQNRTQLQRINDSKKNPKQQQHHKAIDMKTSKIQKPQKKSLPTKKLQIQSESQSEQYYHPGAQIPMFDLKQRITAPSDKMQLQNQGNYLENQYNNNKPQKMQIEVNQNIKQSKLKTNDKNQSQQQQDSMDMFMNEMNKNDDLHKQKNINNNNNNKPSIGAKSMPAVGKQTASKLNDFCSKFSQPPAKSGPVKQASLFSFMAKKK